MRIHRSSRPVVHRVNQSNSPPPPPPPPRIVDGPFGPVYWVDPTPSSNNFGDVLDTVARGGGAGRREAPASRPVDASPSRGGLMPTRGSPSILPPAPVQPTTPVYGMANGTLYVRVYNPTGTFMDIKVTPKPPGQSGPTTRFENYGRYYLVRGDTTNYQRWQDALHPILQQGMDTSSFIGVDKAVYDFLQNAGLSEAQMFDLLADQSGAGRNTNAPLPDVVSESTPPSPNPNPPQPPPGRISADFTTHIGTWNNGQRVGGNNNIQLVTTTYVGNEVFFVIEGQTIGRMDKARYETLRNAGVTQAIMLSGLAVQDNPGTARSFTGPVHESFPSYGIDQQTFTVRVASDDYGYGGHGGYGPDLFHTNTYTISIKTAEYNALRGAGFTDAMIVGAYRVANWGVTKPPEAIFAADKVTLKLLSGSVDIDKSIFNWLRSYGFSEGRIYDLFRPPAYIDSSPVTFTRNGGIIELKRGSTTLPVDAALYGYLEDHGLSIEQIFSVVSAVKRAQQ